MKYMILCLLLIGCLVDQDDVINEPVCTEVKKFDSYCFYPLPRNTNMITRCGFTTHSYCLNYGETYDGSKKYYGTCEETHKWVTECK